MAPADELSQEKIDAARALLEDATGVAVLTGAGIPAAGLVDLARSRGASVCEFNLEPSLLTPRVDVFIPGDAAETLPRLIP